MQITKAEFDLFLMNCQKQARNRQRELDQERENLLSDLKADFALKDEILDLLLDGVRFDTESVSVIIDEVTASWDQRELCFSVKFVYEGASTYEITKKITKQSSRGFFYFYDTSANKPQDQSIAVTEETWKNTSVGYGGKEGFFPLPLITGITETTFRIDLTKQD